MILVAKLANKGFQKGIGAVIESLPDDFGGGIVKYRGFRSDGEYIGNSWKENTNGETYQERLRARGPDILARADDLRARVEAVDRKFNDKYGWGETSNTVSFSRKQQGSERAAPQGGSESVSVTGRHYSDQQRQNLEGCCW